MPTRTTVDTPSILLAGSEVDTHQLNQLVVTQTIGAAAHANLRLDGAEDAVTRYTVGSDLVVKAPSWGPSANGSGTEMIEVFAGVIVSVGLDWRANRAELIVDAYDKSHGLAQNTVIHSYVNSNASTIVTTLAQDAGLTVEIARTFGTAAMPFVQQHGTAHRFITELVHNEGHEWWMEGKKLVVKPRSGAEAAAARLGGDDGYVLRRFQARFSTLDRTSAVNVRGWDPKTKREVTARAKGINAGAPSTPTITQTGSPPAGEATSWPRRVVSVDDARNVASGIAARMGATLVSARGECDVAVAVRPGAIVKVQNVNTKWNGDYYITESEHVFGDGQPFVTRFVAGASDDESIAGLLGAHGGGHGARLADGLTIGIVTNNSDEDSLSRVKVRFPYLSDQGESAWARLVTPGGGAKRGLHVVPEIDDEVLVGFENGDIRRPYVLGGLWNGKDAAPAPSTGVFAGSSVKTRSFTTRKGHFLSFVDGGGDADDAIHLALEGSRATLVISGEKIDLLTTEDKPLTVKTSKASIVIAAGGDITLKGKNITLDAETTITLKGTDVKIDARAGIDAKAKQKVSIKGTAGVEVDGSPGMTDLKGSMVNIN